MNAERLLALYATVAEAPDAVPRLRRFVLDLAVRGKLVPQEAGDEPASELLKQIAAEKARLVKAREIRRDNTAPLAPSDQHSFPVPMSWEWVPATFPTYGVSDLGKKIKTKDVLETGAFPVVDQGKILVRGYCDDPEKVIKVADPMIVFGDHTRETKLIDFDFVVGADGVKLLQPVCVDASFYFLALQWLPLDSRGYGRHFKLLKASALPLPPLAEQRRIVAKVEELMALLDRLEAARGQREATRDRLTAASLARLTAPDAPPEDFPANARFALATLPALTTRPDQIKPLRQTILNLAVRGKLVKQDPTDEPVILPQTCEVDCPEMLPKGWRYARLADLLAENTRNGFSRRPDDAENGVPILRISAGTVRQDGVVAEEEHKLISGIDAVTRLQYGLQVGDLLACRFNGNKAFVGRLTLFKDYSGLDPIYPDKLIRVRLKRAHAMPAFIRMAGESDLVRGNIEEFCATTVGNWGISASNLKEVPFPLPPLAEQHRIVAKVDALMALCDRLEAALTTADATRARLLEALLQEALDPAAEAVTEAAE